MCISSTVNTAASYLHALQMYLGPSLSMYARKGLPMQLRAVEGARGLLAPGLTCTDLPPLHLKAEPMAVELVRCQRAKGTDQVLG